MQPPIFDAHCHIIDPCFSLIANNGYLPEPFTVEAYQAQAQPLGVRGGAVVSGSFQGFDQDYLLAALAQLGPTFVGVTQLPAEVSNAELHRLQAGGVRAIRFNLKRGGSASASELEHLASRVFAEVGWHAELYVDSRDLPELAPVLRRLPAVSIDHLGLSGAGFTDLLHLVEHGVRVKATGFGRVDFAIMPALQQLHAVNPQALMFGSDLPSTRAPRPFQSEDLLLIEQALGAKAARQVCWQNAVEFYRL